MKSALATFLAICLFSQAFSQNLKLPVSNYTNRTYGRSYDAANYSIVTDHRNFVYAGNANGIIEYDGNEWRFIPVRQGAYVTSLDVDDGGRIFVGSQNEFGYLEADMQGMLQYHSLSDSLDEFDRFFTNIWKTHAGQDAVYFQSEEILFIYRNKQIHTVYPETSFHTSFLLDGKLYIRERSMGLMVLDGEELHPVKGGLEFADLGIFAMFNAGSHGGAFIATRENGFYTFHPDQGMQSLHTENDNFLIQAGIMGGIPLSDGNYALNTLHEGVIVLNRDGKIRAILNKHTGLQVNDVKSISQDETHNIWCALDNGISKVDYNSPVSFYHQNAGLEGSVHTTIHYRDRLYVGTTSGLYVENKSHEVNRSLDFSAFPGIRDQVWSLIKIDNSLMIGTLNGLYCYGEGRIVKVSDQNSFSMLYLDMEKLLLVGGNQGLSAYRKSGSWKMIQKFPDVTENVKSIALNPASPYDAYEIWLGTSYQGVLKILLKPDLSYESSRYFGEGDGLTADWVLPITFQNKIVFGTRAGLFQFNDEISLREALPDSLKNIPEYSKGYFEGRLLHDIPVITPINYMVDAYEKTWAVIDNEISLIHHNMPGDLVQKPFKRIDLGKINIIYPEDENTIWFGAADGLARFDMADLKGPDSMYFAAVRRVAITGDSVIYHGAGSRSEIPALNFSQNNVSFYFTTPFYENEIKNQFSWRLAGDKAGWNEWTTRRITTYTNLHEGKYEFQVRAKNIYGDVSQVAGYEFAVRPPWYRTVLAYIIYLVFGMAFIFLAVRLGQMRLRRKNEKLEAIVQERTAEIRKQNIELAQQKKEITDSIYYAERIQRAILPQIERIKGMISGYFILFKPKDIVSGDFYWLAENGKKIIIAAVDCTGHGVPGAFMSMLGVSFLNKIILENNTVQANRILNDLRQNVIQSLKQTGKEGEARDGMDMSLVVIDMENMSMEFAGANNPMYMIREDELNETKADRMPIAYHIKSDEFSNQIIPLRKGDNYYLFSDGFADQFGGPAGKKYKYRPFRELLLKHKDQSMDDQKKILEDTIETWKAGPDPDGRPYEQVEDIRGSGIRM